MVHIPPNLLFSVLSFIAFLLAGFPLPWHMQTWNMGSCMYMVWTSLGCLILFINSIVWDDNTINSAPVWCDISARYLVGASVGIPASSFCIVRRLYYITKLQTISVEKEEKRREIITDVLIGIGFPCIVMVLQYVVQPSRFLIIEQIGCYPSLASTIASFFLILMWPLVIGSISLVYAVLTFRLAFRQKERLKNMLAAGFSISSARYWRLMALCTSEIIFTVPLSIYVIVHNVSTSPPVPYVSWDALHTDFSQVVQVPAFIWATSSAAIQLEMTRWFYVLCAFVIFAFFGWSEEVRGSYCQAFWSICRLGNSKPTRTSVPDTVWRRPHTETTADEADRQMESGHLSVSVQAWTRRCSSQALITFETASLSESLAPGFRLSTKEGPTDNAMGRPSLSEVAEAAHPSCESVLEAPAPAVTRDRCLYAFNQNVGQIV